MFERSPYPLLSLKLLGSLCPCLEKEEDGPARRAAWALSSVPVRWHRRLRGISPSGGGGGVSGFISGMFGGGSSGGALGGGGDSAKPLEGVSLSVVDSGPSGPQLVASPPGSSGVRKKCIPLKLIKKVQAGNGGITIMGLGSRSGIEVMDNKGRQILRFDVLKSATPPTGGGDEDEEWENENGEAIEGGAAEDADESTRDDIIHHLEVLVEWERRRQAYIVTLGEDDENEDETYVNEYDDDDGETPAAARSGKKKGVIAEKAQKIKHFAQREIEMKKMKKEREKRKAKYVDEAGGLKYTAIAMANRS